MLTPEQEKWISHLSKVDKIKIIPFDPSCFEKFESLKKKIVSAVGFDIRVEHHGATNLKISGQDEIDVYIPVSANKFDEYVSLMKGLFGAPRSCYPLERARFVTEELGKHIDIFVINENHINWENCLRFEKYLFSNSEALDQYRALKEDASGQNVQKYYRRKIEFINEILSKD
jgi:GrpB-like predicted nucleotidyltransferase (UPF0157 family)